MADATIKITAEDKTAAAINSAKQNLSDLGKQAALIAGGAGVLGIALAGLSRFSGTFSDIAKGLDKLNDIKDATGASIENISALENVAKRTGSTIEVVESALIKFNAALKNSSPDSEIEKALAGIGLKASELKAIDPAEALSVTAVALAGYADDGDKARLVQELFGKSLKEVAPLLNDLATQTELVGTVTKEAAEQAERWTHAVNSLHKNSEDFWRGLIALV